MIEADLAHLRFLHQRSIKGDILTQEDFDFMLELQEQMKASLETIQFIIEQEKEIQDIPCNRIVTDTKEEVKLLTLDRPRTKIERMKYLEFRKQEENRNKKATKKTNKKVILPIHDYVREIYTKYNGNISSGLTVQHFNRYMKKICKKVGLDEPITYSYTKGGVLLTDTKPKYELISSHTARRSAATNMYLTGRFKTFEIMSLTGHTTEKSFFRYIKVTNQTTSKHISGDSYFNK